MWPREKEEEKNNHSSIPYAVFVTTSPSPSYQNSQNDVTGLTISKLPLAPPPSVDCYSQAGSISFSLKLCALSVAKAMAQEFGFLFKRAEEAIQEAITAVVKHTPHCKTPGSRNSSGLKGL